MDFQLFCFPFEKLFQRNESVQHDLPERERKGHAQMKLKVISKKQYSMWGTSAASKRNGGHRKRKFHCRLVHKTHNALRNWPLEKLARNVEMCAYYPCLATCPKDKTHFTDNAALSQASGAEGRGGYG